MDQEVKNEIEFIKERLLNQQAQIFQLASALERTLDQHGDLYKSLHKLLDIAGVPR